MKPWFSLNRARSEKAMTLVEVMMAVTIFSIVFVAAAGAFFSGVKLWGRISKVDAPAMFIVVDLQKLAKDLRQAVDIPLIGFTGAERELSFPVIDDIHVARVVYTFDPNKKELVRKIHMFDPAAQEGRPEGDPVITKILQADEMTFSYLDRSGQEPEWQDAWLKDKGMFRAVRVEGAFKGEPFTKIIILPQA